MKAFQFAFVFLLSVFSAGVFAANAVSTTVLSELDRFEGFDAHLFHAGYLWVGRSRQGLGGYYRLEVYDPSGKQVANLELKHSLRSISAYGESAVIVVGVSAEPNVSQYTIVAAQGGQFRAQNQPVPENAWADRFVGKPGELLFTDPGGNQDDPDLQAHPGLKAQTLFRLAGGEPRYLKTRMSSPQEGLVIGDSLYVIQETDITGKAANLVRVDLKTEKAEPIFPAYRQGLINLKQLENGQLAMIERGTAQVLIVDPATKQITATIPVPAGTPRGLTQLGSCLVVGSEVARQVTFLDLTTTAHAPIAQWDLSGVGDKLLAVRNVAVDPLSGRVYVRSAYACNPLDAKCGPDRNSVVLAEEHSGTTFKQCHK